METKEKKDFFTCVTCKKEFDNEIDESIDNMCKECYADTHFTCDDCDDTSHIDDMHKVDDDKICESCFDNNYSICNNCEITIHNDDTYSAGYRSFCENCYHDRYFYCDGCCEDISIDNRSRNDDNYCIDCNGDDESNIDDMRYTDDKRYCNDTDRIYSAEIECYYPSSEALKKVYDKLPEGMGMTDDGSLNSMGKEFQTPKLSGEKGDKLLKELCHSLVDNEFTVNRTCGLHIHLDTSDYKTNREAIKTLLMFYLVFEPVLYSYLPYSRRSNRYCMPLSQFYHESEILNCYSVPDIETLWYREQDHDKIDDRKKNHYDQTRYAGVNFHSMLANGHIELRHHSGTLDYNKIDKWIKLHVKILDLVSKGNIEMNQLLKIKFLLQLSEKQDAMFEMLGLDTDLVKYFKTRQKLFMKDTEASTEIICAE